MENPPLTVDPFGRTLPIQSVNLPFLGSKRNAHSTFQYLLQTVSPAEVTFVIPAWVVRREHFRVGDRVDFHLPFRTARAEHHPQGEIVAVHWSAEQGEQTCRAELREPVPLHHPVYASLETGDVVFRDAAGQPAEPAELLRNLLRDLHLIKCGVAVYFKHLVPLFSRITEFSSAEYDELRRAVLEEIRGRIDANIATFAAWQEKAEQGILTPATLPQELDLEALGAAAEAELDNELLNATFDTPVIRPYISAIRLLEHRLYLNYNTIVLLYAQAL